MIRHFLIRWASNVAALWVAARLLDGISVTGDQALTLIVAGFVFSAVNLLVKPLLTLITLPLIILTLGIAYFLVNLAMLLLTSALVENFHVDGFWAAAGGTIVVWLVNVLLGGLGRRLERR